MVQSPFSNHRVSLLVLTFCWSTLLVPAQSSASTVCESWCEFNKKEWREKCTWEKLCGGCSVCADFTTTTTTTTTGMTTSAPTNNTLATTSGHLRRESAEHDLAVPWIAIGVACGALVAIAVVAIVVVSLLKRPLPSKKNPDPESVGSDETAAHKIAQRTVHSLALEDVVLGRDEVALGRRVAGGMGGQIFLGKFGMQEVALKESFEIIMNEYSEEFAKEAAMMAKLRHPNVVQFFGVWEYKDAEPRVFLVMQYCNGGDLHDAVQKPENTLQQRLTWVQQVAAAMNYLHSRSPPVIHRDLKPQNVLLDSQGVAKVGDFGSSKTFEGDRDMTAGVGTVAYMAPEIMNGSETDDKATGDSYGPKCDVFSFAVLSLYAATATMPHEGLGNKDIFLKVGMHAQRTAVPAAYFGAEKDAEDTYPEFVALVERMWAQDPADRPPFGVILAELGDILAAETVSGTDTESDCDEDAENSD